MAISLAMIVLQALLTVALILAMEDIRTSGIWQSIGMGQLGTSEMWQATGPAFALMLALGFAAIVKARFLARLLGHPVSGWRWALIWASGAAIVVGWLFTLLPPSLEWLELVGGIPAILVAFGLVIWTKGFGPEDRELFRMRKDEIEELSLPEPNAGGDAPR